MKALIDLEYYLYRIASACEYEMEWEPDVWTYACRHDEAKDGIQQFIGSVREALPDCEQIILAVGDRASFRYGIWPQYKANRRGRRPPAGYRKLIDWVKQAADTRGWIIRGLPDVEADDVLGILCEPGDVIVSEDKDLLSVPGLHLRGAEFIEQSKAQADRAFYGQVLTGDSSDNYPGCPGIGAVNAAKLLDPCRTEIEMWAATAAAFQKKGVTLANAIAQARCARILRAGEYDLAAGTPRLWQPPVA